MTSSPTDLDRLMSHIATINAKDAPLSPDDLADLIAAYRRVRAYRSDPALKTRTRAATRATSEPVTNLTALLGIGARKPAPALPSPARSGSGVRRI